jgi:8-oxo-dGTP diphosphatase
MAGKTVHAAGGIVVRNGKRPLIAVVQRAKDELWVLPRGKLKSNESAMAGARREVIEETGHRVRVRGAGRRWCSSGACRPKSSRAVTS